MPSAIQQDQRSLLHYLTQETELVIQFIDLLEQEADILAAGASHDALASITKQKSQYAEQLACMAAQRNMTLKTLGYGSDKAGLDAAYRKHSELAGPIRQLLDQTARAQSLNTSNGRIINRFLNHNQKALDLLQHLTGQSTLYDASGRKRSTNRSGTNHIKDAR